MVVAESWVQLAMASMIGLQWVRAVKCCYAASGSNWIRLGDSRAWLVVIEVGVFGRGNSCRKIGRLRGQVTLRGFLSCLKKVADRYFTIVSEARMPTYCSSGGHAVAYWGCFSRVYCRRAIRPDLSTSRKLQMCWRGHGRGQLRGGLRAASRRSPRLVSCSAEKG